MQDDKNQSSSVATFFVVEASSSTSSCAPVLKLGSVSDWFEYTCDLVLVYRESEGILLPCLRLPFAVELLDKVNSMDRIAFLSTEASVGSRKKRRHGGTGGVSAEKETAQQQQQVGASCMINDLMFGRRGLPLACRSSMLETSVTHLSSMGDFLTPWALYILNAASSACGKFWCFLSGLFSCATLSGALFQSTCTAVAIWPVQAGHGQHSYDTDYST